jgi:ribonucleoside-diphosphate reductase subunit M2
MNKQMMNTYIEFVADGLLLRIGLNKYYNVSLPAGMEFMNKLNFDDMNNMFEKKSTNYALAHGTVKNDEDLITDDF